MQAREVKAMVGKLDLKSKTVDLELVASMALEDYEVFKELLENVPRATRKHC